MNSSFKIYWLCKPSRARKAAYATGQIHLCAGTARCKLYFPEPTRSSIQERGLTLVSVKNLVLVSTVSIF